MLKWYEETGEYLSTTLCDHRRFSIPKDAARRPMVPVDRLKDECGRRCCCFRTQSMRQCSFCRTSGRAHEDDEDEFEDGGGGAVAETTDT